jgi:hypothetical protein
MSKAKRNSRQLGRGSAPVPTPNFFMVNVLGLSAGLLALDVEKIEVNTGIQIDQIGMTGQPSRLYAVADSDGAVTPVDVASLQAGGGGVVMELDLTGLAAGGYIIVNLGFEPSVRGTEGQWLQPFRLSVTVV